MSSFITIIKTTRIGVVLSTIFLFISCTVTTGDIDPTHDILDTPVLRFENNQIVWDDVPNAGSYELQKDTKIVGIVQTSPFDINSTSDNGEYWIIAHPANDNTHVESFKRGEETVIKVTYKERTKLDKPILTISDNELSWNAVPNAESYELFKDNISIMVTTENKHLITSDTQNGDYHIEAIPLDSERLLATSEKSDIISVMYLSSIKIEKVILSFSLNEITWSNVVGADTYELFKDGVSLGINASPYAITGLDQNGKYTIVAKSSVQPLIYLDSDVSKEIDVVFVDSI